MTWGRMDASFVADIWGQVYGVKVNGVIPWAAVQTSRWVGGDPNPDPAIRILAFASNGTRNPDAFVVVNTSAQSKRLSIRVSGTSARAFTAFRTSDHEAYAPAGEHAAKGGVLAYEAPDGSVTTFFAAR